MNNHNNTNNNNNNPFEAPPLSGNFGARAPPRSKNIKSVRRGTRLVFLIEGRVTSSKRLH